jgi:hypothetical protein
VKKPWRVEELKMELRERSFGQRAQDSAAIRTAVVDLDEELAKFEQENPEARPLPPLTEADCREIFSSLMDIAAERALGLDECFLVGQVLAAYKMAIRATTLGYNGRFIVMSAEEIKESLGIEV